MFYSGVGLCAIGFKVMRRHLHNIETTGLCLPRHFELHILINDHRHKGTFTSQQPSESAVYIYGCVCVCQGQCFFTDKWTALFSAAEFYLKWIPAEYF